MLKSESSLTYFCPVALTFAQDNTYNKELFSVCSSIFESVMDMSDSFRSNPF